MIIERIHQKQGRILEYTNLLKSMEPECDKRFDKDPIYRGALLHYLYLVADSCIALAEMAIKYKELRPPQTYAEAFDILGANRILDSDFAYDFAKIAGFRNLLAHDYEIIDGRQICQALLSNLEEVEKYVEMVISNLGLQNHY